MLSILTLSSIFIICLIGMKFSRHPALRYTTLIAFNLLVIESIMYGYLLFLITQGNCFFLIGNQKGLDTLIKIRLIQATYFAQGKKNFINQLDNTLGYTIGENKDLGPYQSNAQGLRANRNYSSIPNPNLLRMAVFGDSFVFCDGEKTQILGPISSSSPSTGWRFSILESPVMA